MPIGLALAAAVALGSAIDAQQCTQSDDSARTAVCAKIEELGGRFDSAKAGPSVGGAPTVEVLYEPQYGTSFKKQWVSLLQAFGNEWRPLWTHVSEESWFDPFNDEGERTLIRWRYEAGGNRMLVTGSHSSWSKKRGHHQERLVAEAYCYNRQGQRFDRCP